MLYALPTLTESKIADYITANYSGTYAVVKSFTAAEYALPMIMIKAGKFRELEPQTDVYEGELTVSILTQADDVADPVAAHDLTVGLVYDLMRDTASLFSAVNGGTSFNLFGLYCSGYDQERVERALISILEFKINCQTLALS